jgi:hypothetical protein
MAIKYTNIVHFKALQNLPELGFLVWNYTIWQPWTRVPIFGHFRRAMPSASSASTNSQVLANNLFRDGENKKPSGLKRERTAPASRPLLGSRAAQRRPADRQLHPESALFRILYLPVSGPGNGTFPHCQPLNTPGIRFYKTPFRPNKIRSIFCFRISDTISPTNYMHT